MTGTTPNGIRHPDGATKAKDLGVELEQMALDIDKWIDDELPPAVAAAVNAAISAAGVVTAKKCMHREGGRWVWDGPGATAATHYLLPDHDGRLVVRATPFPVPSATKPGLDW